MKVKICKNNHNHVVCVELEVSDKELSRASKEARTLKNKEGDVVFYLEKGKTASCSEVGIVVPASSYAYTVEGHSDDAIERTRLSLAKVINNVSAIEKQIKKEAEALDKAAEKIEVC